MRIYAIAVLHVDFTANLEQVASIPMGPHLDDALLLAGDVSHRLDRTEEALRLVAARFARVFFVPGNHDLWVDDGEPVLEGKPVESSLDRLESLDRLCDSLGLLRLPAAAGDQWWVVPLQGWYEPRFGADEGPEVSEAAISRRWSDHSRCRWPAGLEDDAARCAHFVRRNEPHLSPPDGRRVLTFSHFVPRPELIPPVANLRFKELPRVSGTLRLDRQLRAAGAEVHVFGHTHIPWDATIDGVRYVQRPLAYPYERARRGQTGIELLRLV